MNVPPRKGAIELQRHRAAPADDGDRWILLTDGREYPPQPIALRRNAIVSLAARDCSCVVGLAGGQTITVSETLGEVAKLLDENGAPTRWAASRKQAGNLRARA